MGNRHKAREFTLQILYAIDISESEVQEVLRYFWDSLTSPPEVRAFASQLVDGVLDNQNHIDAVISKYSEHWAIDRMTSVDRNILRMAVYELLFLSDIPHSVTINEAVEVGKKFGSDESGAFVNGILDRIAKECDEIAEGEEIEVEKTPSVPKVAVRMPTMPANFGFPVEDEEDVPADEEEVKTPDEAKELSRMRRLAINKSVAKGKRNGIITLRKGENS